MYLKFAWRYFKAKKSANAINIIAWVTTGVIAFATCCQLIVLSVYNGFEEIVKSLYADFYSDVNIVPVKGKTFILTKDDINKIKTTSGVRAVSMIAEEKALIRNGDYQSVVQLKGVESNYPDVSNIGHHVYRGDFDPGNADTPHLILGAGISNATAVVLEGPYATNQMTVIMPKHHEAGNDLMSSMATTIATPSGNFSVQQDFDNSYAYTNIDFIKKSGAYLKDEFTACEIKLNDGVDAAVVCTKLQQLLGKNVKVQDRYQQNSNLYNTMRLEKWAIYGILMLILIIAAFNMISSLTMLVLEKQQDISILMSMGSGKSQIGKIFLSEGLLLGFMGTAIGTSMALMIAVLQVKFHLFKISGDVFVMDYYPVKLIWQDFLLVSGSAMMITLLAAWLPAYKATKQHLSLR
jgi:lipoprotein-releasing system permease protein